MLLELLRLEGIFDSQSFGISPETPSLSYTCAKPRKTKNFHVEIFPAP